MRFLRKLVAKLNQLDTVLAEVQDIKRSLENAQLALGRIENRQAIEYNDLELRANEFRVHSQWGEDGIIQFLLRNVAVNREIFIEFGVQNYTESNTRFLLINNNWSGLVLDGGPENIQYIRNDPIYWQYNIKAICSFITRDNINQLIKENGITGEIGLLSIDIDGNDYWVWKAINIVSPVIVIVEYNHRFGKDKAIAIPYDENFVRSTAHYSMIYYGASLKALVNLGQSKGYAFVGCNSAGNNAFFVRRDLKPEYIRELTVEEGYVAGQFREARNEQGNLSYFSPLEEEQILSSLPFVEVE